MSKIALAVDAHNKKIDPYACEGFIVIASGSKKKRFTVYLHEVWMRGATPQPSKYRQCREFIQYLTGQELELSQVKMLMRKYKTCMFKIEVDELRDSREKVAEIEPWKFIPWGKYKYALIDDLVESDPDYCAWLIKTREEKRRSEWNDYGLTSLDSYIVSEGFKQRVAEKIKLLRAKRREELLKKK